MFLSRRSTQAEYFDTARPAQETAQFYSSLARLNRLFLFARPFQRSLPPLLGEGACAGLSLLDLGAGDGLLGRVLGQWAAKRGWNWQTTNLDLNFRALNSNSGAANVAGSALALPFRDGSFDVVIASQMTHHLTDDEAEQHFREAWRVARMAIFISDLHRNPALFAGLWLVLRLGGFTGAIADDGLLSVRRGWRVDELERIAQRAGMAEAKVRLYFGARVLVWARRGAG
jgi:2-polyprenyl-3-methyl-5-hydroxy-6-metoxy-1,4-benzoquinol methylase